MPPPTHFRARAHAKINLGLKILGRRGDGFHELRTVYQTIALADRLTLGIGPGRGIALEVRGEAPAGAENLAYRAAALGAEAFGIRGRIAIRLEKRIPAGAGLGGGSSDAAAVLRMLALARRPGAAGGDGLLALAASLGCDVPPFLVGGTVLGLGRGEEVYGLPDLGAWHCALALPGRGSGAAVATPAAFAQWDREHRGLTAAGDSATIMEFCSLVRQVLPAFRLRRNRDAPPASGPISGPGAGGSKVQAGIGNDFQAGVFSLSPDFPRIHRQLRRAGAVWVSLTGSGAAQFGLFAEAGAAAAAAQALAARHRSWATRFVGRREFSQSVQATRETD